MIEMEFKLRNAEPSDYARIISVMPDWWNGRDLTALLPKLFLDHFYDTSFVVEEESELIGFLIGFMSQSRPIETYIHFIGVHPDYRKDGIGATLYQQFFQICRKRGRSIIHACTSPVNKGSIAFHTRMGFQVENGAKTIFFTKYLD